MEKKEWTGERLETHIFNNNTIEHLHRYALAIDLVRGKTVLDIASGEGYGSNLLSKYAEKVYGVDIDHFTIKNAQKKYKSNNLEFKSGTVNAIPLDDKSVDVVVSFETLEHHDKHLEMMMEIKRVLNVDGVIIMSTPDKKYYSEESGYNNPFHVKELYTNEFKELINSHFNFAQFYFQNMFRGSLVIPEQKTNTFTCFDGSYNSINSRSGYAPMYVIAIASSKELPFESIVSGFNASGIDAKEQEQLQNKIRDETMNFIKSSWNFRIGKAILWPFRIFKK